MAGSKVRFRLEVALARGYSRVRSISGAPRIAYGAGSSARKPEQRTQHTFVRDLAEPEPRVVLDHTGGANCPIAWHPNGRTLYRAQTQILAVDTVAEKPTATAVTSFVPGTEPRVYWFLSCAPDGSELLFRMQDPDSPTGERGGAWLVRLSLRTADRRTVPLPDGHHLWMASVSWRAGRIAASIISPDWKQSEIRVFDFDGHVIHRCATNEPSLGDLSLEPEISPDGSRLAIETGRGLAVLDLQSLRWELLGAHGRKPAWSPDGGKVAFVDSARELFLLDIESHRNQRLAHVVGRDFREPHRLGGWDVAPVWSGDGRYLWFSFTRNHRLLKPARPNRRKFDKWYADIYKDPEIAEKRREWTWRTTVARSRWTSSHKVGVVDLVGRKVWLADGHWRNVGWAPATTPARSPTRA
jgi:hypothetical protein